MDATLPTPPVPRIPGHAPASHGTTPVAAGAPTVPAPRRFWMATGAAHRSGPGCSCGCVLDSQTGRCIEPWNPPGEGNDLGPVFLG